MEAFVLPGLNLQRGRVACITSSGTIQVVDELGVATCDCSFLQTSAGPPPQFREGDEVVYMADASALHGYVLGVVTPYVPPSVLKMPETETPRMLRFEAEEEIELRCGGASIVLTRAGKVLLRGAYLLSRSSGVNRIKGGSVQIN